MADLYQVLRRHFGFRGRRKDNLPHLATPPRRDGGRLSLAAVLRDMEFERGVEIGVKTGKSALYWCRANPRLHLSCVDPWSGARHERNLPTAIKNLQQYNTEILRMTSMEAVERFEDNSLDFVHIDGNHEFDYCAPDIIFWSRKVKPGGLILVHDYLEFYRAGVMEAVKTYTHCHHIDPWYCTRDRLSTAFWQVPAA